MSTLQIIGHDFCQVLIKLADQELKGTELIVPFEDLFVASERRLVSISHNISLFLCSLRITHNDEKHRSSSSVSSSSSSSSTCSLSSADGGVR